MIISPFCVDDTLVTQLYALSRAVYASESFSMPSKHTSDITISPFAPWIQPHGTVKYQAPDGTDTPFIVVESDVDCKKLSQLTETTDERDVITLFYLVLTIYNVYFLNQC